MRRTSRRTIALLLAATTGLLLLWLALRVGGPLTRPEGPMESQTVSSNTNQTLTDAESRVLEHVDSDDRIATRLEPQRDGPVDDRENRMAPWRSTGPGELSSDQQLDTQAHLNTNDDGAPEPTHSHRVIDAMFRASAAQDGCIAADGCVLRRIGTERKLPRPLANDPAGFVSNGLVLVVAHAMQVTAFELPQYREIWSKSFPRLLGWPAIAAEKGIVLVPARSGSEVFAVDITSGELKWQRQYFDCRAAGLPNCKYEDHGGICAHCALVGDEMYHVVWQRLYCTSIEQGSVLWHSAGEVLGAQFGSTVWCVDDELVFTATCPDTSSKSTVTEVSALARRDGQITWSHQIAGGAVSAALVHLDGTYVLMESCGLVKLQRDTGVELWRQPVVRHSTSAMSAGEGHVVIAEGNVLRGIDCTTGNVAWTTSMGGSPVVTPWPLYLDGLALVVDGDGSGLFLSQLSGEVILPVGRRVWATGGAQLTDDGVVFISADMQGIWIEHAQMP